MEVSVIVNYYYRAKRLVCSKGFYPEIYWQERVDIDSVSAQQFLTEHAWVILSSGMSVHVVSSIFNRFAEVFKNWSDIEYVLKNSDLVRYKALSVFANGRKVEAILQMTYYLSNYGLPTIIAQLKQKGPEFFEQFPLLGPATSNHFAKNIGLNVAKADRHLMRISSKFGHSTQSLCTEISKLTGDKISVVDLVLWRYATITKGYLEQ